MASRERVRRLEKYWYDSGACAFDEHAAPLTVVFTPSLIRLAGICKDGVALDLACGSGSSTLSAAEIAGVVVGADVAPTMLKILRAKAKERGVKNIVAVACDAESLPFAEGSFDFIICQFGLMHFVDRRTALKELHRVLRPGGRVCACVWSVAERVETLGLFAQVLKRYASSVMPREVPSWFDLGAPGVLDQLLREVGFAEVGSEREAHYRTYDDAESYWRSFASGGRGRWVISQLPSDLVERMKAEIAEAVSRYKCGDGLRFMMEAVYAYGIKPRGDR